jgi:hypothetical protein
MKKSWSDKVIEPSPMKRNNWTNKEIMEILKGLMLDSPHNEFAQDWNDGLAAGISQFYDFERPITESGACAVINGEIVHVGPVLPR